ncbi:conjugative transposon protein TraM [Pedobacter psychrodurus]|uniref:Conjugative transposon protein TraM n=1 Tax=Pedobacter psychrodurus TaxID=2530456 RepID=A0A4R0PZQ7_9SPHI|nr:conjugative transposon protein TraM [Pedobacter psychrodurus]TCD28752.1 conjugative transposon protein TraM [Pedobacter psychrodurus]
MKINLKQPRYVVPLLALPFLCLFFYVYQSSAGQKAQPVVQDGMNSNVADISDQVRKRGLTDKLDAYRDRYKDSQGNSAINNIEGDEKADIALNAGKQKNTLDSIDRVLKSRGTAALGSSVVPSASVRGGNRGKPQLSAEDRAMAEALSALAERDKPTWQPVVDRSIKEPERDPMEVFKKQMSYMDSMGKANDPEYQAELKRKEKLKPVLTATPADVQPVTKRPATGDIFNTVMAEKENTLVSAVIDENVTGYSGSRIRIRILEDLFVGSLPLKKGTYLYAEISGFSQQRVKLSITSIAREDKIIPVRLDVYDLDGLEGLYVPSSNFREFSRNLGTESVQGFSTQGGAKDQQEFLMSAVDRIFTSTSSAISGLIRKNKAKVKYNSRIYLIDPQSFQKQSK